MSTKDFTTHRAPRPLPGNGHGAVRFGKGDANPFPQTDVGNARYLSELHGGSLLRCAAWGCDLSYDGKRWSRDSGGAMLRAAIDTAGAIADKRWSLASQNRGKLTAMAELARVLPELQTRPGDWDANPLAINLANGTYDFRADLLRPHDPADRITQLAPTALDPAATCSGWLDFVDWLTCGDRALARYLQVLAGYCLTGLTHEKQLFILFGPRGNNAKTTWLTILLRLLGDYATTTPARTILVDGAGDHPTALADLAGKRLVWVLEVGEGQRLNESLIKGMTGSDPIKCRRMREDPWQYVPQFKLWLPCNYRPEVRGVDSAIWARLPVVPFNAHVADDAIDPDLPDKLIAAEGSGILNWLIAGCRIWLRDGLRACDAVAKASADYRADMDELGDFFASRTVSAKDGFAEFGPLYRSYLAWAGTAGVEHPKSKRSLGLDLKARGFRRQESNGSTKWWGIRLREQDDSRSCDNAPSTNGSSDHLYDLRDTVVEVDEVRL